MTTRIAMVQGVPCRFRLYSADLIESIELLLLRNRGAVRGIME